MSEGDIVDLSCDGASAIAEKVPCLAVHAGSQGAEPPLRRWGRPLNSNSNAAALGAPHASACSSGGWVTVRGDDALRSPGLREAREEWLLILERASAAAPFEDPDFPAEPRSIAGSAGAAAASGGQPPAGDAPPRCRCGAVSAKSPVRKEGPTKGRPYWHCAARRCGFFAWADVEARRDSKMWWRRFPDFVVVSDFGFRAEDLRQGGVGDCWFMSALAVVAERPDLILRLFGGETARNGAGCYQIQLFLDGQWQAVRVDDRLPCTDNQRRPDGTGIAYSRADGQQLWSALVEKAYAKAHGSYKAISGGEIAEALLDLTGCPTESIDFDEHGFDPQELWHRLQLFKDSGFPMGCATVGNPELREVGLCGNHAYSILDVREIFDERFVGREEGYGGARQDGMVRLLRIRNPHGVGEWNGEWSDKSAEWTDGLAAVLGRSGVDDGTFWMDYTHFLMAFQVVDVCMAHRGWHAQSFDTAFCARASGSRLCRHLYKLQSCSATTLYAMALQPTKRGSWCRDDRKKSYKPGDISLFLIRLSADGSAGSVVGGNFFGADIMARRSIQARLDPGADYLLAAFCFGAGPTAHGGEARGPAPFRVRLFSSEPLPVQALQAEHSPQMSAAAMSALHAACLTLAPAPGRRFRRLVRRLDSEIIVFQVAGEGSTLLLVANMHDAMTIVVSISADVKVMTARGPEGLLTSSVKEEPKEQGVVCFNCGQAGHIASSCPNPKRAGIRPQWRYPAKWRRVTTTCSVPAGTQRLALVLSCNGMQAELGSIELELRGSAGGQQHGLERWLPAAACGPAPTAPAQRAQQADAFQPRPLARELVEAACRSAARMVVEPSVDLDAAAIEASRSAARVEEERRLQEALAMSRLATDRLEEDELQLQKAVAASVRTLTITPSEEEQQLRRALAASVETASTRMLAITPSEEELQLQRALAASVETGASAQNSQLEAAMLASLTSAAGAVEIVDSDSDVGVTFAKRPKVDSLSLFSDSAPGQVASGTRSPSAHPPLS